MKVEEDEQENKMAKKAKVYPIENKECYFICMYFCLYLIYNVI
jgi:hypothetical protein